MMREMKKTGGKALSAPSKLVTNRADDGSFHSSSGQGGSRCQILGAGAGACC